MANACVRSLLLDDLQSHRGVYFFSWIAANSQSLTASQVEADLAKSMLEAAGIDSMIQADRAGGMRDHLAWSGLGFKVLVREEDAAEAHDVLQTVPEEFVSVQAFGTQAEADTASDMLPSAGILATIQDSVGIPVSPTFRVLVNKKDADKARNVLKQLREAPTRGNG